MERGGGDGADDYTCIISHPCRENGTRPMSAFRRQVSYFSLFLLCYGNSIWLSRWPLSRPFGHELARGTKKPWDSFTQFGQREGVVSTVNLGLEEAIV